MLKYSLCYEVAISDRTKLKDIEAEIENNKGTKNSKYGLEAHPFRPAYQNAERVLMTINITDC